MFSTLKKIFRRAMKMCDKAYIIFKYSLIVCCVLLSLSLICLVVFDSSGMLTAKHLAHDLLDTPAAVLLVAGLGSACVEDFSI